MHMNLFLNSYLNLLNSSFLRLLRFNSFAIRVPSLKGDSNFSCICMAVGTGDRRYKYLEHLLSLQTDPGEFWMKYKTIALSTQRFQWILRLNCYMKRSLKFKVFRTKESVLRRFFGYVILEIASSLDNTM